MNYYIKQGLISSLFFFSMIPFGTAQLTVEGLLHKTPVQMGKVMVAFI